ncbi:MAG: PAS domain S-box protein [Chloroflexi bacterium]|nr:PAS domain S-box protein [Chloroflexota bacterium]
MTKPSKCLSQPSATTSDSLATLQPAVFDAIQAGLVVIDRDHRVIIANRFIQDWVKRTQEEMRGQQCFRLFHDAEHACVECPAGTTFRTGEPAHILHTSVHEDTYVEITTHPIKDDRGEVTYVIEYVLDVSERMRLVHALRDSEEKYRTVVEHCNDAIWILDRAGNYVWFNRRAEELGGYKSEDWQGKSFAPMIVPEDLPMVQRVFAETLAGKAQTYEVSAFGSDGQVFVVQVNTTPIISNGEVVGTVSFGEDITHRKRAEEALRRAYDDLEAKVRERTAELARINEELRAQIAERKVVEEERERLLAEIRRRAAELDIVITSVADALVIYAPGGQIVRMNPAAERMLGYTPAECELAMAERLARVRVETPEGKPFPLEQMPAWRALHGETVHGVISAIRNGKETLWALVSGAPVRTPDGQLLGAVAIFTDITALHELQAQREAFVHTISHDLRAPLTSIRGHAQLLQRVLEKAGLLDLGAMPLEAIATGSRQMNVMIQDMVDSVRLETGQLQLRKWPLDLKLSVPNMLRRAAGVMSVGRVRVDIAADLPSACTDPDRLERIMLNLVSNALKYSAPETEVCVKIERVGREALVTVRDRGVGIAAQDLPHIFERFYRSGNALKAEGLGLGLYITRMLVEAHGGRIWAESELGKGTSVYLTLPLA